MIEPQKKVERCDSTHLAGLTPVFEFLRKACVSCNPIMTAYLAQDFSLYPENLL